MKIRSPRRPFSQKSNQRSASVRRVVRFAMLLVVVVAGVALTRSGFAQKQSGTIRLPAPTPSKGNSKVYAPVEEKVMVFPSIKLSDIARQESLEPVAPTMAEIRAIHPPKDGPNERHGVSITPELTNPAFVTNAPPASPTGPSPIPTKTFQGEFLSGTTIPPDTMGAVGTTHVVTVSNNMMRIQNRNGVQISRQTLSSFWTGITLEGSAAVSAFDPKVYFDRFGPDGGRFILIASANAQSLSSAVLFAVSATSDPTGTWNRYAIDADAAATAAGGSWIDFPSVGFNKNWIIINENVFNYGTSGTAFWGTHIYVIDKANIYTGPVSPTVNAFKEAFTACTPTFEIKLGCGFTMSPTVTEDNTTETAYLIEDWDSQFAQLRLSKVTGTAAAPILTIGTQLPQSVNSWRFNAVRIGPSSGGYAPMRQQSAHLTSGTRIMANDSRITNAVLRNGSLWTTHTVMLSTTPQLAGVAIGSAAIPDNHAAVQWWQIDPTIETGVSQLPIQRGRIEDPTANNCHNGAAGIVATPPCSGSTLNQVGQFYVFPSISVNQNNDVLLGFTQFSNLSYPAGGYAIRRSADTANTFRDPVMFRPGQSNYNIGAGSGAARQNRWGDYSYSQTDPLNDTDFWTIQEYSGTYRDFGIGVAGPWETWWAQVSPTNAIPSTSGNLIISEFRLRGPQGARDEFVELYNPSATPLIVNTTDNSDGWTVAFSNDGTTVTGVGVIPNGTIIPGKGHFLLTDNPDSIPTLPTVVYSLSAHPGATNPSTLVRGSDNDTGWAFDLPDNGGLAIFKTTTIANFAVGNRMDSVGFSGIAAGLFREGVGLAPNSTTTPTGQMSFVRKEATGAPQDTGANENDFVLINPVNELTPVPTQGAAGPQNLGSPIVSSLVATSLVAPCAPATAAPNRVRTGSGNAGTLEFRRTFTNNTGASISRLRFRIVDITTAPAPSALFAILSVQNSVASTPATCPSGTVSLAGLTLETPPTQAAGGGLNSTLNSGDVTLTTPLANGASINVNFLTNVVQAGVFRFFVNVEALP